MKQSLKITVIIFLAYLLSGCAMKLPGKDQAINVKVIDSVSKEILTDVNCSVIDSHGVTYQVMSNPGVIVVPKSFRSIKPNCSKEGYIQKSFGAGGLSESSVDLMSSHGLLVDLVSSGTIAKYPSNMIVVMERK